MSSSEQLTLGAKLCAILIRHLRYLPLSFARWSSLREHRFNDSNTRRFCAPFSCDYLSPPFSFSLFPLETLPPFPTVRRLRARRTYKGGERKERRNNAALHRLHQNYGDTRSNEEHRRASREQRIVRGKEREGKGREGERRERKGTEGKAGGGGRNPG